MNRDDFLILNSDIIYLDNAATTLKPKVLSDTISDYYNNYSSNVHRGDYDISIKADTAYYNSRELVKNFIGAKSFNQIVFTNNATDSLNKVVFGYFKNHLNNGDTVLLTKAEHASNVLPWFELKKEKNINIDYIPLNSDLTITLDNVKKMINPSVKVISIAHITNVIGDIRPVEEIISYAHSMGIKVVIDATQSVGHKRINVSSMDPDFLVFSAHKMYGPTGVGVIYIKEDLVNSIEPIILGGGMNASFNYDGEFEYSDMPYKLEAGTPNISGVIGLSSIINYLNMIGMDKINAYENDLREYALNKLKTVPNIIIYNTNSKSSIIAFNIKDIFAQDIAIYLNKHNICVRAGTHCAKMLKDELGIKNTCRISISFYNTKEEIDKLVDVLSIENLVDQVF